MRRRSCPLGADPRPRLRRPGVGGDQPPLLKTIKSPDGEYTTQVATDAACNLFGEPKPGNQYRLPIIAEGYGIRTKFLGDLLPEPKTGQVKTVF